MASYPFSLADWPDCVLMAPPDQPLDGPIVVPVRGWAAWTLVALTVALDSTGAGGGDSLVVQVRSGATLVLDVLDTSPSGPGVTEIASWAPFAPTNQFAGVLHNSPMPLMPVRGDGTITLALAVAQLNWVARNIALTVCGTLLPRPGARTSGAELGR